MATLSNQFHELLKTHKGNEVLNIIERILESDLYITSEYLSYPGVQALKAGNKHYDTLYLFSMLTYSDYKKSPSKYLTLNNKLLNKLKCVSILEIAKEKKFLEYSYLKNTLDIKENYELEELLWISIMIILLIEIIYIDTLVSIFFANKCIVCRNSIIFY